MEEVVPARTSPTLHPPSPPTVHQFVATSTLRVKTVTSYPIYLLADNMGVAIKFV